VKAFHEKQKPKPDEGKMKVVSADYLKPDPPEGSYR
jgi:hypothetical protein